MDKQDTALIDLLLCEVSDRAVHEVPQFQLAVGWLTDLVQDVCGWSVAVDSQQVFGRQGGLRPRPYL